MADETSPPDKTPAAVTRSYPSQAVQMVRTVTHVNLTLSQMADQKASILMGATFVVFTITVGLAGRGSYPLPLMVLAFFSFLSAVFAVAVVMPATGRGPPRTGPKPAERANILFFDVFAQLSEEEFTESVLAAIATEEGMFRTMLRDIYQNGQVLRRKKYRCLGIAYRIFLAGLTLTLVAFLFESRDALTRYL
jgi:hypothetical protein